MLARFKVVSAQELSRVELPRIEEIVKVVIVSGFFNPLHGGHLDMIEAADKLGDKLIVVVNNDVQQRIKKGTVILTEQNRARLINALKYVDEVIIAIDNDSSVIKTLEMIAKKYPEDGLIFANGGDRDSVTAIPESAVCDEYNIQMIFGVGGTGKTDSSTRINQALGYEK
jgi:glycerol-3-phosphate cytidylyltransferase/D-beta-D-heptose 7-phosphate kinase/D-beta-D-heptose 1-phosphate adenosyltransferase